MNRELEELIKDIEAIIEEYESRGVKGERDLRLLRSDLLLITAKSGLVDLRPSIE